VHIGVVSLFPPMFEAVTRHGITARAIDRGLLRLDFWNPRDYARDRHRTVDDRPFGGGPGMIMQVQPLRDAIRAARASCGPDARVLYLSPQGRQLDQGGVQELAARNAMVLVTGRYEGIDERIAVSEIDEEWSIGDYVLTGGELAAMVVVDALTRLLPGALGHVDSAAQDSFAGGLLDCPHYTRPAEIDGMGVPEVLLSGDHAAVQRWRDKQALGRTWQRRPDLLVRLQLSDYQQQLLQEYIEECGAEDVADASPLESRFRS
jgi:tRNA (guanine37-N1)-methyltransferase